MKMYSKTTKIKKTPKTPKRPTPTKKKPNKYSR